jgi:hypothetical protein
VWVAKECRRVFGILMQFVAAHECNTVLTLKTWAGGFIIDLYGSGPGAACAAILNVVQQLAVS